MSCIVSRVMGGGSSEADVWLGSRLFRRASFLTRKDAGFHDRTVTSLKMSSSPTPEEREKKDAEAKAREAEEQAKLPYKWTQSIGDVDITIPVPGNLKGRDLDVVLTKQKLKAGVKGQTPIVDVCN